MAGDGAGGTTGVNGDQHYLIYTNGATNDFQSGSSQADYVTRLANSISNMLASDAKPGSIVVANGGHMDAGPGAQSAVLLNDGTQEHVVVTFGMDGTAPSFSSLSNLASLGAGWTVGTAVSNPDYSIGAQIISSNQIELTFAAPVPSGNNLYYEGIGDGHITFIDYWDHAGNPGASPGYTEWNGEGAAIYDSKGMPIQVSAFGLGIGSGSQPAAVSKFSTTSFVTPSAQTRTPIPTSGNNPLASANSGKYIFSAASGNSSLVGGTGVVNTNMPIQNSGIPAEILNRLASVPAFHHDSTPFSLPGMGSVPELTVIAPIGHVATILPVTNLLPFASTSEEHIVYLERRH